MKRIIVYALFFSTIVFSMNRSYGILDPYYYYLLYSDVEAHEAFIHRLARFVKQNTDKQEQLIKDVNNFCEIVKRQESRHSMLLERLELDELNMDEIETDVNERLVGLEERYRGELQALCDSLARSDRNAPPDFMERIERIEDGQVRLQKDYAALKKQLRFTQLGIALAVALKLAIN